MHGPFNGKGGCVYILTNPATTLYTGATADPHQRTWQHKAGLGGAFTRACCSVKLLYYE